jgi:Holliday junction resolvase
MMVGKTGNNRHESKLVEVIKELEGKGFRVVKLCGKSPDAIATRDGKIIAIEVIGKYGKKRKYKLTGGWTIIGKKRNYSMFDDVLIFTFPYDN